VFDNRKFGRKPLVGSHQIRDLQAFTFAPETHSAAMALEASGGVTPLDIAIVIDPGRVPEALTEQEKERKAILQVLKESKHLDPDCKMLHVEKRYVITTSNPSRVRAADLPAGACQNNLFDGFVMAVLSPLHHF